MCTGFFFFYEETKAPSRRMNLEQKGGGVAFAQPTSGLGILPPKEKRGKEGRGESYARKGSREDCLPEGRLLFDIT